MLKPTICSSPFPPPVLPPMRSIFSKLSFDGSIGYAGAPSSEEEDKEQFEEFRAVEHGQQQHHVNAAKEPAAATYAKVGVATSQLVREAKGDNTS